MHGRYFHPATIFYVAMFEIMSLKRSLDDVMFVSSKDLNKTLE
jgi:hypothetical protein